MVRLTGGGEGRPSLSYSDAAAERMGNKKGEREIDSI